MLSTKLDSTPGRVSALPGDNMGKRLTPRFAQKVVGMAHHTKKIGHTGKDRGNSSSVNFCAAQKSEGRHRKGSLKPESGKRRENPCFAGKVTRPSQELGPTKEVVDCPGEGSLKRHDIADKGKAVAQSYRVPEGEGTNGGLTAKTRTNEGEP